MSPKPSSKPSLPSGSDLQDVLDDSAAQEKIEDLKPTWDDVRSMGGTIIDHEDGTRTATLNDPTGRAMLALAEASAPMRRAMADAGMQRSIRHRDVTLIEPSGKRRVVPEQHAERAAKRLGARELESRNPHLLFKDGVWYRRFGSEWRVDG